jgi:hypothetical protein
MEKTSKLKLSPTAKRLLIIFAGFNALLGLKRIVESIATLLIYKKDFLSGYLLAKAMLSGVNPYLPLPELANRWLPAHNITDLQHSTPHPFAVGWLCLPWAWLDYETAARLWLVFELGCLVAVVALFFRAFGRGLQLRWWLLATLLLLGWVPVIEDLWLGQFSLCLALLLTGAWLALRDGRDGRGGVLLGLALSLKLVGWPVVLFLALRRRWRGVLAAGGVFAAAHLLAAVVHGWAMVKDYYLVVGPQVSALYRTHDANFSLWTVGTRLFAEAGFNFVSLPLWPAPALAKALTVLVPLAALLLILRLAWRAQRFGTAFALLVGAGVMLNPIGWTHYFILLAFALSLIVQRLRALEWPRGLTYRLLLLLWPLSVTQSSFGIVAKQFAVGTNADGLALVPGWAALVTMASAVAVSGLLWLLVVLERATAPQEMAECAAPPLIPPLPRFRPH